LAQLIKFTLRRGPTVQTEMSLSTAGIHCTISQRLSGAMEDCSIVRVQQPRTLCRQRCCMSASRRMFGSLWNAAAAHEHRRQDGTMAKCQKTTRYLELRICCYMYLRKKRECIVNSDILLPDLFGSAR